MNIVIYTNILTPYRTCFFEEMYDECKKQGIGFHVLVMADTESGRAWHYKDFQTEYTTLLHCKTFSRGETHIHYNNNLKDALRSINPDIIVCAGSYLCPGIWTILQLKNRFKYKVLFWSESHLNESRSYSGIKVRIREIIRNTIYKKFDGFWYAGKLSKELIQTYCSPTANLMFMPNLVDGEVYKKARYFSDDYKTMIKNAYQLDKKKIIFICPARLIPVKGIDKFIPIFAQTIDKKDATLLIAGAGEQETLLQKLIKDYQIDVRLLGYKDQKEMVDLYSISDYFVLPSISDANPLTCIEALWAGLPLLISENCGNYPEVINQGVNGFSFDYKEPNKIVEVLDRLIVADSGWKCAAKVESIRIVEEKYDSKLVVERILKQLISIR